MTFNSIHKREILEGSNIFSKISYPPSESQLDPPLSTQFLASLVSHRRQQIDTPPPEQKAQRLENENEAKSRCQMGRQKVRQWISHGHAIGVRQSLSRA